MSNTAIAEAVAASDAKAASDKAVNDEKFEAADPKADPAKPKLTVAEQKAAAAPAKPATVKTQPVKATAPKKPAAEPQFAKLISKLSQADSNTKALSADTAQARAERGNLAVTTLKAAFGERLSAEDVRKALIDGGVLKGTVSKITTILSALYAKSIKVGDIKSLNGAYTIVQEIAKAEKANAPVAPGTSGSDVEVFATPAEPIVATTPEQALEVLFNSLRSITDGDEMFRLAGEYLAKLSNGIDKIVKEKDAAVEK